MSPGSGLWSEITNWSFGLPDETQSLTIIANAGSKTVTVDSSVAPANLTVQRVDLSAPLGETNRLVVRDVALELRSTLTADTGGELVISNGTLRVNGSTTGSSLKLNAGQMILQSGSLETVNVVTELGRVGQGELQVLGGNATLQEVLVGKFDGSQGRFVVTDGSVNISSNFNLGDDFGSVGVVLITGGELTAMDTNSTTRVGDDGDGIMTISNGVVRLDDVSVARHLTGTLVLAGGMLFTGDISIGRFSAASGTMLVTGGELHLPKDSIRVGREGGGVMTISGGIVEASTVRVAGTTNTSSGTLVLSGGDLLLSSSLMVGSSVATGQVLITDGLLTITNDIAPAYLEVQQGNLMLSNGTVIADSVILTNATGQFSFTGGTLMSSATVVSNGAPFVVGDGVSPATFRLLGGTHVFADGLVISPGSRLVGCGTIIGTVTNNGIVTTPPPVPLITNPEHVDADFHFSFATVVGRMYVVLYKNGLTTPNWSLLEILPGTGNALTVFDLNNSAAVRFYRICAE